MTWIQVLECLVAGGGVENWELVFISRISFCRSMLRLILKDRIGTLVIGDKRREEDRNLGLV